MAGCDTNQTLLPIDAALDRMLSEVKAVTTTELMPIIKAHGRILAEDLSSTISVPSFDNSAMDGYAIALSSLKNSNDCILSISQRIPAGSVGRPLKQGTAARIFTGAPIPKGADAVVMQELCNEVDGKVNINSALKIDENIRFAGEDICKGDIILQKGAKLKPQEIGLAASVGITKVKVYRRLRVAIFFTGDELRESGEKLEGGQIYNSNRYTMSSLLESLDCELIDYGIVEDSLEATKNTLSAAAKKADLVMTSGGVSVGEEDYIRVALEELGQLDLWRVNVKPGKPLVFGKVGSTAFLGMPGNPVSVFVTFCLFARPFILKKQGANNYQAQCFKIPAGFEHLQKGFRNEYMRAKIENGVLTIYPNQSSGVLSSVCWADGLAFIPMNTIIKKGDLVEFTPFSELNAN